MSRGPIFRTAMLAFGLAAQAVVQAETPTPALPSTVTSQNFPQVTSTGTDAGVNADMMQLASDTRDQLAQVLQLGPTWRFSVHIHVVMADDPLADRMRDPRVAVTASEKTLTIEAAVPGSDPELKTFVQRQFITALLWEKFFANTKSFDTKTDLGVVPVWLIEGLTEWVREDGGRDREAIVRRAAATHRAPTLKEITSWQDISRDRLLGLYQRSFCYYLVSALIHGDRPRAQFQEWLATFSSTNPARANLLFPSEEAWQQQLLQAPERSHDIIYTWDESAMALVDAETIVLPPKKGKDARPCTLDNMTSFGADAEMVAALRKKVYELTGLELRAHPSWRPIFALYRFGATAMIDQHGEQARAYIRQAQNQRVSEEAYHQKLVDYVNWFEVTKDYAGHTSHFDSYFTTAQAMEQVQADTARPNPIRADLIQVESRL